MYRLCASQSIMYYVLAPALYFSTRTPAGVPVFCAWSPWWRPPARRFWPTSSADPMCLRRCARILPIRRAVRGEPTGKHRARCTNSEQYS